MSFYIVLLSFWGAFNDCLSTSQKGHLFSNYYSYLKYVPTAQFNQYNLYFNYLINNGEFATWKIKL